MKEQRRQPSFRVVLLAVFGFLLPALAYAAGPADTKMSINVKSLPVEQVLDEIHRKAKLDFFYDAGLAKNWPKVTLRMTNKSAEEVIDQVTALIGCTYTIKGNIVTITQQKMSGKERTIKGYVRDESGEPIIGAPICIGETRVCTVTDAEGFYTFKIPVEKTTLKYSYVGLSPEYVQIAQGNADVTRDVVMRSDNQLGEVVVTGIFSKAKESYTGAVSQITQEQIELNRGQNLLQTLKNIDASINFAIDNINGSNPNNLPQLNIRGSASLPTNVQEFNEGVQNSTNTPLIIMDGFEISLTKLMDYNDDEIESINILKDAAATAIYGSRGANGVIVVITKRPTAGQLKTNIEVGTTIEMPDISSYHLLNAADKLQLEFDAGIYNDSSRPLVQQNLRKRYYDKLHNVLDGIDTDWLAKPVRMGVGQNYKARFEGGNEEFRWGASLSYNNTEGAMKGSKRQTFNGGITLMYSIKNLTFRNYTSIGINKGRESKYGTFSKYAAMLPYYSPYNENGRLVRNFSAQGDSDIQNPLYDASLNIINENGYKEIDNNFSIDWNILPVLRLRGQFGISSTDNTSDYFLPSEHSTFYNDSQYSTDEGYLRRGSYTYGTGRNNNLNASATLAYNNTFADKHQLYAGLNYEVATYDTYNYNFKAEGFSSEDITSITSGRSYAQNSSPYGSKSKSRRLGLTSNINYTYDNRYYVDFSYRIDGSSAYGSDKKWAPFWSAGIGWNLHNEKWLFKNNDVVNRLKLRASYGETGSQLSSTSGAVTSYSYITTQKYLNWTGAIVNGLGNSNLTWQKTKEFNVGLEFGLWDDRIKGTLDVYSKNTSNLLSYMNLPLSVGFSQYLANVGEVKNNGFEASLAAYIIRDREHHFNWIISGQLVYDKNEISKLSDAVKIQNEEYLKQNVDVSTLFFEGRPQNSIYAVQSLGIDPSTGNEIFIDRDGNQTTTWNAGDKVFLGSAEPLYRGNLGSTLIYKKFTLNFSFSYHWGGYAYNSTLRDRVEVPISTIRTQNVDERVLSQRWFQPGDVTFFKRLTNNEDAHHSTSRYVMKDNVLQLQTVGLQYRWDTDWIRKAIRCNAVIFAVNMNDLLYFSSIKRERGTSYPYARNLQASVKLSF